MPHRLKIEQIPLSRRLDAGNGVNELVNESPYPVDLAVGILVVFSRKEFTPTLIISTIAQVQAKGIRAD